MVSAESLGSVADSVAAQSELTPRAMQLDCWWFVGTSSWSCIVLLFPLLDAKLRQRDTFFTVFRPRYPRATASNPDWCVSDWIPPEDFFPNGTGSVRASTGLPLLLYFPAICPQSIWTTPGYWPVANYTWADSSAPGGVLVPSPADSARFWGDIFDFGLRQAALGAGRAGSSDAWPRAKWVPPMVREGWRGTNVAAYETDFYSDLVTQPDVFRQVVGAGEMFLQGIVDACRARNMTVQLCNGGSPHFLEALTMPEVRACWRA